MYTAAVITISDKGSVGQRVDTSGPALVELLKGKGYDVVHTAIIPDDFEKIQAELVSCADEKYIALVLTTGGTGFSPRDITPEAMQAESMRITPRGCLSRSAAGIRKNTLIINLPGSKKACLENIPPSVEEETQNSSGVVLLVGSAMIDVVMISTLVRKTKNPE